MRQIHSLLPFIHKKEQQISSLKKAKGTTRKGTIHSELMAAIVPLCIGYYLSFEQP